MFQDQVLDQLIPYKTHNTPAQYQFTKETHWNAVCRSITSPLRREIAEYLLYLASLTKEALGACTVYVDKIAKKFKCNKRVVQYTTSFLEEMGIIKKVEREKENGQRGSNIYVVVAVEKPVDKPVDKLLATCGEVVTYGELVVTFESYVSRMPYLFTDTFMGTFMDTFTATTSEEPMQDKASEPLFQPESFESFEPIESKSSCTYVDVPEMFVSQVEPVIGRNMMIKLWDKVLLYMRKKGETEAPVKVAIKAARQTIHKERSGEITGKDPMGYFYGTLRRMMEQKKPAQYDTKPAPTESDGDSALGGDCDPADKYADFYAMYGGEANCSRHYGMQSLEDLERISQLQSSVDHE